MNKDLRQFLQVVRELGPDFYIEVNKPLNPYLEPCVIQQKLACEGRFPVIYCPEIEGSKLPLVTNLFGSREMMGLAMDLDPRKTTKGEIFHEFRRRMHDPKPVKVVPPSGAPVKEVIMRGKDVDLGLLPIIHSAVLNSGKYIPIGSMICKTPDTGIPNIGVYRHELRAKNDLGCMINPGHHAGYIIRHYAELGKKMEVAIFIGHYPSVIFGGSLYTGRLEVSELEIMGGFLGEPLEVIQAETVDLLVPAAAEIVIEGVIDPLDRITDGPYSEYTGYYGEEKRVWHINVTAITMRKDAIYHDLDPSHREHTMSCAMGLESATYDAIKNAIPSVKAVYFPHSGVSFFTMYISIAKRIQGEGIHAGLVGLGATTNSKIAIVVDEDVDVYNEEEVLWAMATRMEADQDIVSIPRTTGAHLDPSAYDETRIKRGHMTSKVIIDATKPAELPFSTRITPPADLWESMKLEDYIKK